VKPPRNQRRDAKDKLARRAWALLADGKPEDEVRAELEMTPVEYRIMRARMFELEGERIRAQTPEAIFLEYSLVQLSCMAEADRAIQSLKGAEKGGTAYVAAIKAKSDLYDKIMKFGQDLGLIHKKIEEKRILKGVVVAQLSNEDLHTAIVEQALRLQKVVDTFGAQTILELAPGDIHYVKPPADSPTRLPVAANKTNRARTNQAQRGRFVQKEKLQ
jgi:hypothetical protein